MEAKRLNIYISKTKLMVPLGRTVCGDVEDREVVLCCL